MSQWKVYILEATDGTLYTGVTTDIARRFREHSTGPKGARYFKGRTPLGVVYLEHGHDRSSALKREAAIKRLTKQEKVKLKQQVINPYDC